jgi:glycosyltransferase involved in cell wall biosynthesis
MLHHLIVHQFDPSRPVAGGVDGYIRDLIRFAPAGHTFSVVGVDAQGTATLGKWTERAVSDRTVRFMPVTRLDSGDQRRRVPHTARLLAGTLRFRPGANGALVQTHRAEIGACAGVLFRGSRSVQFIHTDTHEQFRHRAETYWRFLPGVYRRLERQAVRGATRTIVMSSAGAEQLRRLSPTVELGANWYDGETFWRGDVGEIERLRIGWVGRLEVPKNPLAAVRGLARLRDAGVEFDAWFAGQGTLDDDARLLVSELRLDDRVSFLGYLPPERVAAEMRASSMLLMTSLWEGSPRAAVEAMATGIPVVAPDVGDLRRLVRDGVNGVIAASTSSEELVRCMLVARGIERGAAVADTVAHLEARTVVGDLFARVLDPVAA